MMAWRRIVTFNSYKFDLDEVVPADHLVVRSMWILFVDEMRRLAQSKQRR
jgi:hypothetical protein